MAGGGPDAVELQQVLIDQHQRFLDVADRTNAADRVADVFLDEPGVGAAKRTDDGAHFPLIDPVGAAGDHHHGRVVRQTAEHDRLGDGGEAATQSCGGLGRGLAGFRQHHDRFVVAERGEQIRDALRGVGEFIAQRHAYLCRFAASAFPALLAALRPR